MKLILVFFAIVISIPPLVAKETKEEREEKLVNTISLYTKVVEQLEKRCSDIENSKDQYYCPGPHDAVEATVSELTRYKAYLKQAENDLEKVKSKGIEEEVAEDNKITNSKVVDAPVDRKKMKTYLIQKSGGINIESYCKFLSLHVSDQIFLRFDHSIYYECKQLVLGKKGMYEDPNRWNSNFVLELDRAVEEWASTSAIIDKVFNNANKVQKLREHYLKMVGGLNFDTYCKLGAQSSLLDVVRYNTKPISMNLLIKKCHDSYLPSQKNALGKNKAALLGAIDTLIIFDHFDTEAKVDQLLRGDVSSYKAP